MVAELARHLGRSGDPLVRQRLADVHTHAELLRLVGERVGAGVTPGGPAAGSILKLLGSTQNRRIADLAASLLGPAITADTGEWGTFAWSRHLCGTPGLRIAGGTDEVQRNILGERVLGLPREPAVS
jgi:alkylation response protein AidB-like acyl-CoA dehydrogenase